MRSLSKTSCLLTSLIICLFTQISEAQYGGGTGTAYNPYLIYTPEQMNAIGAEPNDWDKHFKLMRDLDFSTIDSNEIMPIGDDITAFTGTFDGADHSISNYTCLLERLSNVGVFGILVAPTPDPNGNVAVVENLHLVNAEIRGASKVGGLVGWNRGTITGCSVDGNVIGLSTVGGLVGINQGEINTCCSKGTVSSQQDKAGGLVGQNMPIVSTHAGPVLSGNGWAHISKSFSSAHVTGEKNVGGLVGIDNGTIANCYSSGSAIGQDKVGGLIGDSRGRTISFCYSTAYVIADVNAGGLIGSRLYYMEDHAFCVWDIDKSNISISVAGRGKTTEEMMSSKTYYCWGSNGNWTLDEGNDYPHLTWENRTGRPISEYDRLYGGGTGDANDPYLISTPQQFITIGWYEEDFNKHFLLMEDLDFNDISSTEIRSIGNAEVPFTGVFDGQNFSISNIKLSLSSRHVGVFGVVGIRVPDGLMRGPKPYYESGIDAPGTILNLQVSDAHLTGLDMQGVLIGFNVNGTVSGCSVTGSVGDGWSGANDVLGGLVGRNMGLIDKCMASCYFKGGYFIGGLVGSNYGIIKSSYSEGEVTGSGFHIGGLAGDNTGHISDCYSRCVTQGGTKVGGLVGSNSGEIINSFCSGNVSGELQIGGLVGLNYGSVTNSYSTGSVSGVEEIGGLVGSNGYIVWQPSYGRVSYCYSTGRVSGTSSIGALVGNHVAGSVTSCFWDMETSYLLNMCGKEGDDATGCDDSFGKITAEMQTAQTFLEAGWDFVGETENGTENIWWIDEGKDYPRLWWEPSLEPSNNEALVLVVDDFESYNDLDPADPASYLIYLAWILPPTPAQVSNGAIMGHVSPFGDPVFNKPSIETVIVHGGSQSGPLWYNNTGAYLFSEVWLTFAGAQDWAANGATMLSLWFYGDPTNTPGQLYFKINDFRIDYDGDPDNLTRPLWRRWNIDLVSVDTNLQSVTSIAIGVDGLDAKGTLLIDEIGLYASGP